MALQMAEEATGIESRLAAIDKRLLVLTWVGTINLFLTVIVLFTLWH